MTTINIKTPIRTKDYADYALNEALLKVLTTKFKKDAPAEFKMVSDAGYEVYKVDGMFRVYNANTHREIHFTRGYGYRVYGYLNWTNGRKQCTTYEDLTKVNIVGVLNTPPNYAKRPTGYGYWGETKTKYNARKLCEAKMRVKCADESIDRARRELEKAQKELERTIQYRVRVAYELNECRKELNLKEVA